MSDPQDYTPEEQDACLAAEVALGLAEGAELAEAQARARSDRAFAALIAGWQERFAQMTDDIAPVAPRRRAKKALLKQMFPKQRVSLMQRLWVWQGIALAALVFAAYITFPTLRPAPDNAEPLFATQLQGDSTLKVMAVYDPARGDIALRRLEGGAPQGRVLELWAILPEGDPISLGVLPEGDVARVVMPAELAPQVQGMILAISEEPPGGAPEGTPSGAVLAVGPVSEL